MPQQATSDSLAPFQNYLIGTWTNQALPGAPDGEGSEANPLSYNVMALPQAEAQKGESLGYILKNCTVYETTTFTNSSPPPTTAPNRADGKSQLPTALYYNQQVFFGDGPQVNLMVHTENGAWLYLVTGAAIVGPYGPSDPDVPNQQSKYRTVAKQISVPHGNSVLALGSFGETVNGSLTIPNSNSVIPKNAAVNTSLYCMQLDDPMNYQNPIPSWTKNPNLPLQKGVELLKPDAYLHWSVTTAPLPDKTQGQLANIPFEQAAARVTQYTADYWLMSTDGGKNFDYLAYSQFIDLSLNISGVSIDFPHVTTNFLTRQK